MHVRTIFDLPQVALCAYEDAEVVFHVLTKLVV